MQTTTCQASLRSYALSGLVKTSGQLPFVPASLDCSVDRMFAGSCSIGIRDRISIWDQIRGIQFLLGHIQIDHLVQYLKERPSISGVEWLLNPPDELVIFLSCDLDLDKTFWVFRIDTDAAAILLCIFLNDRTEFAIALILFHNFTKFETSLVECFLLLDGERVHQDFYGLTFCGSQCHWLCCCHQSWNSCDVCSHLVNDLI